MYQGEGGVRPADKSYFEGVRTLCDETGALFICDEVQTGVGRTGKMWGHQVLGVEPDIFTSAKVLLSWLYFVILNCILCDLISLFFSTMILLSYFELCFRM